MTDQITSCKSIEARKSCRAYLNQEDVNHATIEKILE